MSASRKYWTLLERDDAKSPWRVEYGSYDVRDTVGELDERVDAGHDEDNLKVIYTGELSADILAEVHTLNGGAK